MEQLSDSRQMIGGAHPELLPFRVSYIVKRSETLFSEGQVLSNADRCGMFICERGEVEVSFEEQTYVIHRGDMYIYLASSLVRIRKIHPDTEGFLLDGNLDFLTVLANRVLNAEQILFIRYHPCLTLTEAQHKGLRHALHAYEERLRELYTTTAIDAGRRMVLKELYQSLGSSFFFEVIYIYLTNKPLDPKPLSNRDLVFQRFYSDLSRHYHKEREVTCLTPLFLQSCEGGLWPFGQSMDCAKSNCRSESLVGEAGSQYQRDSYSFQLSFSVFLRQILQALRWLLSQGVPSAIWPLTKVHESSKKYMLRLFIQIFEVVRPNQLVGEGIDPAQPFNQCVAHTLHLGADRCVGFVGIQKALPQSLPKVMFQTQEGE